MPLAATWRSGDYQTKWSKSDRNTHIIWYHLYVESKKMIQMNLFTKQKETHRLRKQHGYQRGNVERRDKLGVWDWHIPTTIFKIDNQQGSTV